MNKLGYVLFGLIVLVAIIQNASTQSTCKTSCDCRSMYCRAGKCIRYGQIADERDENGNSKVSPCAYTECYPGSYCYIQEVQCGKAPCPGRATCVNDLNTCTYK